MKKTDRLEISSEQLHSDLTEIKERIAALETIATLANQSAVEAYVKECLTSDALKKIVAACEQPKTKDQLRAELDYKSTQALDHHLKPLRECDLLQQEINDNGIMTFRWSNLFARLKKKPREQLLGITTLTATKAKKINK